jgi:hypothetical protein
MTSSFFFFSRFSKKEKKTTKKDCQFGSQVDIIIYNKKSTSEEKLKKK